MEFKHIPVLLEEAVATLGIEKGKKYIDATLGGGGYTIEIARNGGRVLAIDQDLDAIEYVRERLEKDEFQTFANNITLIHGNFGDIGTIAKKSGFEQVSGIVFDLGVSSYQLEQAKRGFSFSKDEPLDMRMDKTKTFTAADIIQTWKEEELYELITKKGEEHFARAISRAIVVARRVKPIGTSLELADVISKAVPRQGMLHPATKTFQALRIEVNNELENLKEALVASWDLLESKGKIVVVSFHSLEDRIVKQTFQRFENEGKGVASKKIMTAGDEETYKNRRSRSAKLRYFIKT